MLPSYVETGSYMSYKKLVNTLKSNFGYNLSESLIGCSTSEDVKHIRLEIQEQQKLIAEGSYEYTNNKYRKNVIVVEALNHLVKLLEIRTYRLEPKTGSLVD